MQHKLSIVIGTKKCLQYIYIYIDQLDAQTPVISLYFSLGALHVSDFLLVHHQERLFISCTS